MDLARILVVDDEPDLQTLIRQKFRNKIKANEYEFHFAENGAEALERLSNDGSIDLILTDINMPVMDGLTLLSKINDLNKKELRSVIVSAYGDMENIRTAMNRGAYDFVTKPIDLKDLEVTIEKSLKEIEQYKVALLAHDKLVALKQELDIAKIIQTSMLPKSFPAFPGRKEFDIYARMIPAKEVGGDLYDYFLIDKYRVGIIIGDVSGKGVAAAILMAVCKTLLRATALKGIPADDVLTEVNRIIVDESPSTMFVTVFYGVLDTRNGSFEYSNGGHNAPYLLSADGSLKPIEDAGGLMIGAMEDSGYESKIIMLQPGDSILFYTDGVTEAFNKNEEEFSDERLRKLVNTGISLYPEKLVDLVFSGITEFTDGCEQSDDITCMSLKYLGS